MTLAEYLAKEGRTASDLAKAIGVTTSTITRLVRGERTNPSVSLAIRIERATGGLVSVADMGSPGDKLVPFRAEECS